VLTILGVAGCATYHPAPLAPVHSEQEYRMRTLTDPGLRQFAKSNLGSSLRKWPPPKWDLSRLTLVAFYYHPDLDVALARVAVAEAGIKAAGGRLNPRVGVAAGHTTSPESPWLYGFNFDIPTGAPGKRHYRVAQARALTEAARLQVAETAWQVRSRLRAALVEHLLARRKLELLRAEETARADAARIMEQRLAVGEISRPDMNAVRAERSTTRVALKAAEGRVTETLAMLAAALGVPVSALAGAKFNSPHLDQPLAPEALAPDKLQRAGLLNRIDVRRALAEYAATEAALHLEIAKQYPNIHLGPSYAFDDGQSKYKLGVSLALPLLNRNQGPIAEAEARRKQSAAQFLALQAKVIGETDQASARYRAALASYDDANTLVALLKEQESAMQHAVQIGESDSLALAGLRVRSAVAARSSLTALHKAQLALGDLENAVQRPLDGSAPLPPVPERGSGAMKGTKP